MHYSEQIVNKCRQGCIYVASEFPTFLGTMWIVSQKLNILSLFILNGRQIYLSARFWDITYNVFNYLAPCCRESKIQLPTRRVLETLKYAP